MQLDLPHGAPSHRRNIDDVVTVRDPSTRRADARSNQRKQLHARFAPSAGSGSGSGAKPTAWSHRATADGHGIWSQPNEVELSPTRARFAERRIDFSALTTDTADQEKYAASVKALAI